MNISNAEKVPGWMDQPDLMWLAEQASKRTRILEVGSWMGRSTRALADNTLGTIIAVDTWRGSDEEEHKATLEGKSDSWLMDEFRRNMLGVTPGKVTTFRDTSVNAAAYFHHMGVTFDMIFLDASHDYDNVRADILAWLPLVERGGIISGHDYSPNWLGVVKAVNELIGGVKKSDGFIWYMENSNAR